MLLKITLFGVFGVMQCVYTVQGSKNMPLYEPPFWNAPIFTKLIVLTSEVCSDQLSGALWLAEYLKHVTEMLRPFPSCDAMSRPFFSLWSWHDETKTIKPAINEAFVAFSEDIIADYDDSYSLFTRCATLHKHNTMSAFVIVETPNKRYSTLLKTHVWIVSSKFFKYRNVLTGCESEAPYCPWDVGIAPLYSVHSHS